MGKECCSLSAHKGMSVPDSDDVRGLPEVFYLIYTHSCEVRVQLRADEVRVQLRADEVRVQLRADEVRVQLRADEVRVQLRADEVRVQLRADEVRVQLRADHPPFFFNCKSVPWDHRHSAENDRHSCKCFTQVE